MDGGREHDEFDGAAVHVLGWDGPTAACTGRLVLPPGPLPTEEACSLVIEPRGEVVDVGRMVVAPSHQDANHTTFVLLLGGLYLEVRRRGSRVACGMMSAPVRAMCRQLGFRLELLGPDRRYWHEVRAPVRFEVGRDAAGLVERWARRRGGHGALSTSTASCPPKPNELDRHGPGPMARGVPCTTSTVTSGSSVRSPATGGTNRARSERRPTMPRPRPSRR